MQLITANGQAAVQLSRTANALMEHPLYSSHPCGCGYEMVSIIEDHTHAISDQLRDIDGHFGLFEDARSERWLRIPLAKIEHALSNLQVKLVRENLELLEKAKAIKDEYFSGRTDSEEMIDLAGYPSDYWSDEETE